MHVHKQPMGVLFRHHFMMSGCGKLFKKRKLDSMDSDKDVDEMESPESKKI